MFKLGVLGLLLALQVSAISSIKAVNNHLFPGDILRLQTAFVDAIETNDLQSVFFSSLNVEATSGPLKDQFCTALHKSYVDSKLNDFEKNFYLIGGHKALKCTNQIPQSALDKVSTAFTKDANSAQEIFYNLYASKAMGVVLSPAVAEKVAKNLQSILKKDESLSTLGYALYISSELPTSNVGFVLDRIGEAFAQADEVDGKMLQFEGGLSITALVVSGAFKASKVHNKPLPLTADQANKFATYFLSRRTVQSSKGAHILLESLKTLAEQKSIAPICLQIIGNGQIHHDSPVLNIKVVDLFGKALVTPITSITGKIVLKKGNSVVVEKAMLVSKSSDKTTYSLDLIQHKLARGDYVVEISADTYTQTLPFKVLGKVKVKTLEIGVGDSDATSALKKQNLVYPNKLSEELSADHTQKLVMKFVLIDELTTKPISVHQAFVRLADKNADKEIIFVAEQDTAKAYKFDMDVGTKGNDFNYKSGEYKLELIVGDASLSNSFQWHLTDIHLKFNQDGRDESSSKSRSIQPEIIHQFRQPDKRPPRFVSDVFTGLCLTPLVLLFIFWGKLGINLSNFNLSLSTVGFHIGFGTILALFFVFWLKLNMFQTIRLLIPIAVFTFLCGNRLLRRIAGQKTS